MWFSPLKAINKNTSFSLKVKGEVLSSKFSDLWEQTQIVTSTAFTPNRLSVATGSWGFSNFRWMRRNLNQSLDVAEAHWLGSAKSWGFPTNISRVDARNLWSVMLALSFFCFFHCKTSCCPINEDQNNSIEKVAATQLDDSSEGGRKGRWGEFDSIFSHKWRDLNEHSMILPDCL